MACVPLVTNEGTQKERKYCVPKCKQIPRKQVTPLPMLATVIKKGGITFSAKLLLNEYPCKELMWSGCRSTSNVDEVHH